MNLVDKKNQMVPMQGLLHSHIIGAQTLKTWFEPCVKELNIRVIPCSRMMEELRKMETEWAAEEQAAR